MNHKPILLPDVTSKLSVVLIVALLAGATSGAFAQYTLTTLALFTGPDGSSPQANLILSGSTLYGTTDYGGANGDGTVFSEPITGGTPTVLAPFSSPNNGLGAGSNLILSGSTLYGTTQGNGTNEAGTVFSLPVTGGTPTVLASFSGTNLKNPEGSLILSGSTLYGTTYFGFGSTSSVFSVPVAGGTPTSLGSFNGTVATGPESSLTLSGSTLYGTAGGGTNNDDTVFSMPVTGGSATVLASFNGANGNWPFYGAGPMVLSGGILYGTTVFGGAYGDGAVFSVPVAGGTPTLLASFDGPDGYWPECNLLVSGSTLYGTTYEGGPSFGLYEGEGDGTVFSVPITGGTPTVLASFTGFEGSFPTAGLIMDSSGNLYGTTSGGGGTGTVFELSPSSVPEPATLSLLTLGSLALMARRRQRAR